MNTRFDIATLEAEVVQIVGGDPAAIGPDDNLLDVGLDSIRLMTLVERWSDAGAAVEFGDLAERPSLAEWSALLTERSADGVVA